MGDSVTLFGDFAGEEGADGVEAMVSEAGDFAVGVVMGLLSETLLLGEARPGVGDWVAIAGDSFAGKAEVDGFFTGNHFLLPR